MTTGSQTQSSRTQAARSYSPFRLFLDHPVAPIIMVIGSTLALIVIGLVMVYSSSSIVFFVEKGDAASEAIKQVVFAALGITGAAACALYFDESKLFGRFVIGFWIVCMIGMVLTALMGTVGLGAKRWLYLGPMSIQPAEFMKIALVLISVSLATEYVNKEFDTYTLFKRAALYIMLPLFMILVLQSDMGSTAICLVAVIAVMWLVGIDTKTILIIIAICAVGAICAILLKSYRSDRMIFLDPWSDPNGSGYQLIHSFLALGAGGLFGTGIGNSFEKMDYLPEAETDFIFAIIGEEMGLVGTLGVIALFLIFLYGSILIAMRAQTKQGAITAATLAIMLVFQAFLNMACVTGIMPLTGKPLPFVSSGGSSMISSCLMVGIILAIAFGSQKNNNSQQRRDRLHVVSHVNQADATRRAHSRGTSPSTQGGMLRQESYQGGRGVQASTSASQTSHYSNPRQRRRY